MKRSLLILLSMALYFTAFCQLPNGSNAPDFDVVDINGNSYSLYAMMGSNKSACLDFSATWCSPCWAFHQSGVLESVYNNLSSYTTVIFLESDWNTNTACLYGPSGCNNSTQGNWVAGTPYQIADLSPGNGAQVNSNYNIAYYPTLYVISPDKRTWEIDDRSYQNYDNWITKSFALAATAALTNSTCGDNGKIILSPTGGWSTLNYKWSNGATSKDLNNLPGGTYSVTITDANTYFKVFGPYAISGPAKRVDIVSSILTHIKCYNDATGSIGIQSDYGTPPYSYNWSNANKTNFNDNLKAGIYTVTVTDFSNCTRVKSYTLNQPTDLIVTAVAGKENCDNIDGYIQTKATGGVGPYNYNIGYGDQQSPYFSDLKGGKYYTVTVTDFNGCIKTVKSYVDVTNKPKVDAGSDKPYDCKKDTINLDGSQSDQGSYLINLWTTFNGKIAKGEETLLPEIIKPGKYYLKITDINNKCFDTDSVDVIDKRVFPNIVATGDTTLNCILTKTEAQGNSKNTTTKFYWKKVKDSLFLKNGKSIFVSDSGKYIFHVKDTISLCISRDTIEIKQDQVKPQATAKVEKDVSCKNTEVIIDGSASSQGAQFVYQWTTANGNIVSGANSLIPLVNKGGDYALKVDNSVNYCKNNTAVIVYEQTQPSAGFDQNINGRTVQFNDLSKGIPTSWNWTFGDGTNSIQKNPEHVFSTDGEYNVCLSINNDCGQDVKCQKILVGKLALILTCPANVTEIACQPNATIDSKFNTWLATATFTGGCNAAISNNNGGAPSACGGSLTIMFTVTSSCDPSLTCSAKFSVTSAPTLILTCPVNQTEATGQTQDQINAKFTTWLASAGFEGGCNAVISNSNTGAPLYTGGSTTVNFTVTSTCQAPTTCNATFTVLQVNATTNERIIKQFELTPNPVNGQGQIHIQLDKQRTYRLNMMNVFGKIVWSFTSTNAKELITIDLTSYSKGLYFMVLTTENSQKALKWVVD